MGKRKPRRRDVRSEMRPRRSPEDWLRAQPQAAEPTDEEYEKALAEDLARLELRDLPGGVPTGRTPLGEQRGTLLSGPSLGAIEAALRAADKASTPVYSGLELASGLVAKGAGEESQAAVLTGAEVVLALAAILSKNPKTIGTRTSKAAQKIGRAHV